MTSPGSSEQPGTPTSPEDPERVVIRDKRRIDPTTGEPRPGVDLPAVETDEVATVAAALLDERTADLQRVQAEYANYRKRADRDRIAAGEVGTARALAELLPVLDDIDRARSHGDITGPIEAIVDKFEQTLNKLGLEPFGVEGDEFDPNIHEAVLHTESDDVAVPTCTTIMRRGFKHGERLLRPAMVGVTDPSQETPDAPNATPTPEENDHDSTE